jgi:hypothetical protein
MRVSGLRGSGGIMTKEFAGVLPGGIAVYAEPEVMARTQQYIEEEQTKKGIIPRGYYPVYTDLSWNKVWVKANSHEDALRIYLERSQ